MTEIHDIVYHVDQINLSLFINHILIYRHTIDLNASFKQLRSGYVNRAVDVI